MRTEEEQLDGLGEEPLDLADMARAIALGTEKTFPHADPGDLLEAMWLAMQLVGGPQRAAATMRYCGVNFVAR